MSNERENIFLLEVEHLIDTNDIIRQKATEKNAIDYSGDDVYPIEMKKLHALIENTPKGNILDIATYYLKNIILFQPFPDGNHRTALASVEFFLNKNGHVLSYNADEALEFQKEAYRVRLRTYGNYDQHDISILMKPEDDFTRLCRDFIEKRLAKHD
ncbi:MAG: Fic family protein [Methanomassiliicoccales archaeon]|nr:MAG: Fic family protein [Methanomassiliicoccales archaeon]